MAALQLPAGAGSSVQHRVGEALRHAPAGVSKHLKVLERAGLSVRGREAQWRPCRIELEIDGVRFLALNGGPLFKFSEAVSFQILCDTQEDVDYFWSKLTEGGSEGQCGWLKDKFGLSWQVVPTALPQLLQNPNPEMAQRAMRAMLQMRKLDIAALEKAAA